MLVPTLPVSARTHAMHRWFRFMRLSSGGTCRPYQHPNVCERPGRHPVAHGSQGTTGPPRILLFEGRRPPQNPRLQNAPAATLKRPQPSSLSVAFTLEPVNSAHPVSGQRASEEPAPKPESQGHEATSYLSGSSPCCGRRRSSSPAGTRHGGAHSGSRKTSRRSRTRAGSWACRPPGTGTRAPPSRG